MQVESPIIHDRIIAKIQYYAEMIKQRELEKESLLIVFGSKKSCEKEKVKEQILTLQEMLNDYYTLFEDIIYR